jgi:hypothetical protein
MSDERDEREAAEDDAKEDLELNDDSADQVRGGLIIKHSDAAPDATWK